MFDWDNDATTGCSVAGMAGVDQVLTTRLVTDATTGNITRTFRQVCTAGALGAELDPVTTGWPAGFQPASGNVLVETRIPFSTFPTGLQPNMRLGVSAGEGTVSHTAIVNPDGSMILFPTPTRGKRRSVGSPGAPRVITLDGDGADWQALNALVDGIASSGTQGLRIIKFFAFANVDDDFFYFRFDANLSADAPFANDDNYQREEGQGLSVPAPGVLANDGDPAGNPLTAQPVSSPSHGNVTLNPDGSFTYTPDNPASTQSDAFEYRASNGTKTSNAARVRITVNTLNNTAPNAVDDNYNTPEDEQLNRPAATGVLANDTDANGDALTATLLVAPTNGAVVLAADGGFTYTPNANFFGSDTFTYTVDDGTDTDTALVTITVTAENDAPTVEPDTFPVVENSFAGTVVGTVSASDVEGDTLTFSIEGGNNGNAFAIDANTGEITVNNPAAIDFESSTQFFLIVRVVDSGTPSRSDEATITINVTDGNDPPDAEPDGPYPVAEGGTLNGTSVLANDSDPDGDPLTALLVGGPANASSFTLNPDGTFTYTHNGGETTSDSFTYRANDGSSDSDVVTVTIEVTAVNDAPVAVDDAAATSEETPVSVAVLANDTD
ncbi:MAG TPA: Ig-like domain-containing protein, partial [Thermoanaerobaculia bacterium]|nr:Ig-like domain-containing protein [Thermoanaerobaculia bacterium]